MNTVTPADPHDSHEGIASSHPMFTIFIFGAIIAVVVAAGSMVSHERHGDDLQATTKVPTLFERLLPSRR